MLRYWLRCLFLMVAASSIVIYAAAQEAASPKKGEKAEAALKPAERFDGRTTLRAKDGRPRELHVVVRNWVIHPGEQVSRFPEKDFTVVELIAGSVITVIDGQEKEFTGGFWAVPAGALMAVRVTSESASFQTITIKQN
jgi:hypothetical protein